MDTKPVWFGKFLFTDFETGVCEFKLKLVGLLKSKL